MRSTIENARPTRAEPSPAAPVAAPQSPQPSSQLHEEPKPQGVVETLPVLLALVFERHELAELCWGAEGAARFACWPSSFYRLVAETACRSERSWRRLGRALELRLRPWLVRLEGAPPGELTRLFVDAPALLQGCELAAALWVLIREADPAYDVLLRKSRAEFEQSLLTCVRRAVMG